MSARPKPPLEYDENPALDAAFFAHAKPASLGENARLRKALEEIIEAVETGSEIDSAIADAKVTLAATP